MHDNSGYITHTGMGSAQMNYHFQVPVYSFQLQESRPGPPGPAGLHRTAVAIREASVSSGKSSVSLEDSVNGSAASGGRRRERQESQSSRQTASSASSGAGGAMTNGKHGSGGHLSSHSNHSAGTTSEHSDDTPDVDTLHNGHIEEAGEPPEEGVERAEAWWRIGEFSDQRGRQLTHQSAKFTLTANRVFQANNSDDVWDLSDSLAELYQKSSLAAAHSPPSTATTAAARERKQRQLDAHDVRDWLSRDSSHGFIRVYPPDMSCYSNSQLVPCTLSTTAHKLCLMLGLAVNAVHLQLSGDKVRRLDPYEHPLVLQNEYLQALGYSDVERIQQQGASHSLAYLVKFYSGKPMVDSTFSRKQLQAWIDIKKGKVMSNWVKRLCVLSGTRLLIHKDKTEKGQPSEMQLAKGQVEEAEDKSHAFVLKLTCTLDGEKQIFLALPNQETYDKWYRKCKKATDKLPTSADLSNCHLEFLPETVFINDQLAMLNLRHNVLKERPIEEDIYTIGWLDDLPRFTRLRSLNLADNNLVTFPLSICNIRTLVELNIASNKLQEIPPDIQQLTNLQALHIHNNHLSTLPGELARLSRLFILVLAFNHFSEVPSVVAHMTDVRVSEVESVILAGNRIQALPEQTLQRMKYVKKADFRMNCLTLSAAETALFSVLEHLTHLDVRDNCCAELDIRGVRTLEYLNVERNDMTVLQVNGTQLKNLFAAHNRLERLHMSPKPEWLLQIDVSHNQLRRLPEWLSDCFFLQKLNAAHNLLTELPPRLLSDAKKLKSLRVNHNRLLALPPEVDTIGLEELHVQHNLISRLPNELFSRLHKLRVFNATKNRLQMLPALNSSQDLNKVQELYLTANMLGDSALQSIAGYQRLKVLHLAHNEIHNLYDGDFKKLDLLQELNISGNQLRKLPAVLGTLSKLVILRAHSNVLQSLPDFKQATALRILDFGHNQLLNVSVTNLMASQLNLLDMSLNAQLRVDPREFKTVKNRKSVCLVDSSGQNRVLPGLNRRSRPESIDYETDPTLPWKVGFSETSGIRNKLCIANLRILKFESSNEALFGMFDGGHNNEVSKLLLEKIPSIVREELRKDPEKYMKYTILTAHSKLGSVGQKLGASAALCHIRCTPIPGGDGVAPSGDRPGAPSRSNSYAGVTGDEAGPGGEGGGLKQYTLHVCNVGDTEMVLCRRGEALPLTRRFTTHDDADECFRVYRSDGIITEDNKVNGTTRTTRCVGNSYLFPHVIPEPYTATVALRHDDEFLIIANRGLWRFVSYEEAVEEVYELGNPVVAAKKLQDMAQGYGSKENISILVVRINTDLGPSLARLRQYKSMSIDDLEAAAEFEERRLQAQRSREDGPPSTSGLSSAASVSSGRRRSSSSHSATPRGSAALRRSTKDYPAPLPPRSPTSPTTSALDLPREGEPDQLDGRFRHSASSASPRGRRRKSEPAVSVGRVHVATEGSGRCGSGRLSATEELSSGDMERGPPGAAANANSMSPLPDLKPLPNQRYRKKSAVQGWEAILQNRLSEDVKDKELKQMSRSVSEELGSAATSSQTSVRKSAARGTAIFRPVSHEIDTASNVDMTNPHAPPPPPPVKPKRIITQPPYPGDHAAGVLRTAQLAAAAEEDRELLEKSASGVAAVVQNTRKNSVANQRDERETEAVNTSSEEANTPANEGEKQDKSVRNTIALFENMKQPLPQPDVNKRTTVVLIERDERGPSNSSQSNSSDTKKFNVEVLKFQGTSSEAVTNGNQRSGQQQNSSHFGAQTGSLEANLYADVRRVGGASTHSSSSGDHTRSQLAGRVGSTEIHVHEEEDEDGEVRIVEIARL